MKPPSGTGPAWRDTPSAHRFYHSGAWKRARKLVWDRAHGLCERCARRGEVKPAEVVHHMTPLNEGNVGDPGVSLSPERLVALCHDCHTEVHRELGIGALNGRPEGEPRVAFDDEGNVVRI